MPEQVSNSYLCDLQDFCAMMDGEVKVVSEVGEVKVVK